VKEWHCHSYADPSILLNYIRTKGRRTSDLKPETLAIHSYAAGLLQVGSVSHIVTATICYPQAYEDVDMNEHFIKMYSGGCTVLRS
jgi:hypothetical protein